MRRPINSLTYAPTQMILICPSHNWELHLNLSLIHIWEYVCVAVCSDYLPHDDIDALRRVRAIPIVVLPAEYNAAQRYECVQRGAAQYISAARHRLEADMSGKDNMRYCLDLSLIHI